MSERDERRQRVEALAKVVAEAWGTDIELPPECHPYDEAPDYFDDVARHLIDSPAMRDLLAEERARALREAADALDDACAHSTDPCFCNNTNRLRDLADRIANQEAR